LSQAVSEPTRKVLPSIHKHLLFVNREGLMWDMIVAGCLGQSDHEMAEFKMFSLMIKKNSRFVNLDFRRATFKPFRELFSRVP